MPEIQKKGGSMDALKLIQDLASEIERDKSSIAVKEKLLKEWKVKLGIDDNLEKNTHDNNREELQPQRIIPNSGVIDVDSLLDEEPKKTTIVDETRDIVERFGSKEFTVQHVDKVYKIRHGIPDTDISNRTRISTALSKLKDAGAIVMTVKGGGNVPNKYRNIDVNDLI
jgi:hypothetical protein